MEPNTEPNPDPRPTPDSGQGQTKGVTAATVAQAVIDDAGGPSIDADDLQLVTASLPPFATYNALVCLEDNVEARKLLTFLEGEGIEGTHISYLALDVEAGADGDGVLNDDERASVDGNVAKSVGRGAAVGGTGGAVGGALAGVALLAIPGVGTLAGLGILGALVGGAVAGGPLGAVWGGYSKLGLSDAWEHTFVNIHDGKTIVGVHTDDREEFERVRAKLPTPVSLFDQDGRPQSPSD